MAEVTDQHRDFPQWLRIKTQLVKHFRSAKHETAFFAPGAQNRLSGSPLAVLRHPESRPVAFLIVGLAIDPALQRIANGLMFLAQCLKCLDGHHFVGAQCRQQMFDLRWRVSGIEFLGPL
ncbi:hypothetical protein D3C85_1089620 [compost metagenome]